MRPPRWEYKTLRLDVAGWLGPKVDPARFDAELNALGDAGWELVSALDVNRAEGATAAIVALFKRARD
jgi:hypothetical protein